MKRVILMSAVALAALASDGLFAGSAANMPESASAADKAKSLWTEDIDGAFFDYVLEVASGKQTKNEERGYREISIFKDGVTL